MTDRDREIRGLWRARPRSVFLRWSLALLAVLCVGAWFVGDFPVGDLLERASTDATAAFLERAVPRPVRGSDWDGAAVGRWAADLLEDRGWTAIRLTVGISVAAIVLAAIAALLLCLPAAQSFATPEPFLPTARPPHAAARFAWGTLRLGVRTWLVFLRSVPEYVWAFLLFGVLGASAWPAVLALAIHNAGILGRLDAEVVENLSPGPLRALRALGARRVPLALAGVYPAALPRFLLYFFYRWETCVRDATVLGMLGIVSLGYWIDDARHRFRYDEMVFWILAGAAIVLLGDLLSALVRRWLRRAP